MEQLCNRFSLQLYTTLKKFFLSHIIFNISLFTGHGILV